MYRATVGVAVVAILLVLCPHTGICSSASGSKVKTSPGIITGKQIKKAPAASLPLYHNPEFTEGNQNPLPHLPFPQHPFLATNGKSNIHNDASMSDTYEVSGPLGIHPLVPLTRFADTRTNMCVTITFDSKGRILTVNARPDRYYILLADPDTWYIPSSSRSA